MECFSRRDPPLDSQMGKEWVVHPHTLNFFWRELRITAGHEHGSMSLSILSLQVSIRIGWILE